MRKRRIIINSIFSLVNRFVIAICGLILPRVILVTYGSEINGLISSITQFLGLISFMDLGVGAVIQTALYKPLAEQDDKSISRIVIAGRKFFRNIAKISLVYVLILLLLYNKITHTNYDFWFTGSLIIILAINSFSEYFFGIINQILINADQKAYFCQIVISATQIINTLLCVIQIKFGFSIQHVKLSTALVFLIRPIAYSIFVKKNYRIDNSLVINKEVLSQKWSGFAQHISAVVVDKTDVVVLTLFSNLISVSIYSVYYLVIKNLEQIIYSTNVGIQSALGDLIARQDIELNQKFLKVEVIMHFIISALSSICVIMLIPFVRLYTKNVDDANYISFIFCVLMSLVCYINCVRNLYHMVIKAAGHFKQTQMCAIIEAIINLIISAILVKKFGLIGVAMGTIAAGLYRILYFAFYLNHNILERTAKVVFKLMFSDCIPMILSALFTNVYVLQRKIESYLEWGFYAIFVSVICGITCFIISYSMYSSVWRSALKEKRFKL